MITLGELTISTHHGVALLLLTAVTLAAAIADCRTGMVRNKLTYPAVAIGFAWALVAGYLAAGPSGAAMELTASAVATGAALLPFAMIFAMGGLGGGDVKLMAAVGAISGDWRIVFATAVYAFIVAAIMAIGVMIGKGIVRQTARRVLVAAMLSASRARVELGEPGGADSAGQREQTHLPFAVAIAIGGIMAGIELLLGVNTPWAGFVG